MKIGMMQGRLSPRPFPKIKAFPWDNWENEFFTAKKIGYDFIEWVFEDDRFEKNPIWTQKGRSKILTCIKESGVTIDSVCADFFLQNPFHKQGKYSLEDKITIFYKLIDNAVEIGANLILLPVLEVAELQSEDQKKLFEEAIFKCLPHIEKSGIKLGLETELEKQKYRKLCKKFDSPYIGAYYDTGNSASKGFNMKEDIEELYEYVIGVHIKDRMVNGKSVFLGHGDTDFKNGIPALLNMGYKENFVMETYFEEDYLNAAINNLRYIKNIVKKVGENI